MNAEDMPRQYLVWICGGCDECTDSPTEQTMPCNGPSQDGAWVIRAEDYLKLLAENGRRCEALDEIAKLGNSHGHDAGRTMARIARDALSREQRS